MRRTPMRRLLLATVVFAAVTAFGTAGFMVLGDASSLDALYMTVVTISQVGYDEHIPLDDAGRVFTMIVILMGVGSITFLVVSGLDFVLEGHLEELLGRRRMDRELARLTEHTIICGFGQVGRHVALHLREEDRRLVVVDIDGGLVAAARDHDLLAVEGDASLEDTLVRVGITSAHAVVASAHDDADNVLISLTAKGLNPDAFLVARIKEDENEAKVRRAGADRVIAPAAIGGRRMAALVTRPGVIDFLDVVTHGTDEDLVLEEIRVDDGDVMDGRTLRQLQMRERHGVTVLAIRSDGASTNTRPGPDSLLTAGDRLVVIGSRMALNELRS